ncbi:DUF1178 family protein [Piscinibacter sp.]|uniref:DUF1178 family protein n=1 Tax=Piscinibacter sp. TaxID=1903157 RepID=UPI002B785C30|nr:DUF1178 family protein [Albitalea sp.]HUG21164.1 DUF1178 family protein [Albitalea sp.]
MKVLNLRCAHDHPFEGWFASDDDFQSQLQRSLIECPMCGDKTVTRLPSAPRLNVSGAREPSSTPAKPPSTDAPVPVTMEAAWLRAVQHVMSHTVDVGDRFAEEARRIHYGEVDERAIRGRATPDEAMALKEEGIEVMSLPVPAALKGPVQ